MNTTKKETVLSPYETTMNVEALIIDAKYILSPNNDKQYVFTFQPLDYFDYGRISEAVMTALQQVEISTWLPSSNMTETTSGLFQCSQLFPPIINIEVRDAEFDLYHKQVSLKLHLRDDIINRIFLQADYIDCYEEEPDEPGLPDDWVAPEGYIDF